MLGISRYTYVLLCVCLTINRFVDEQDVRLVVNHVPLLRSSLIHFFALINSSLTCNFPLSMLMKRVTIQALMALFP